jgi:hypothetical protein
MPIPAGFAEALAERYAFERELGAGGMAWVYLAEDLRHGRRVAIKVFRPELMASVGADRFLREIRIIASLQHPNIVPLLDSGEADGILYYVMPYVDGPSLRDRLSRSGELPVPEAVRLLIEVADALACAHAHGVVHRDIKPGNVMLSGRHALVTDFGIAKALSDATGTSDATTAGMALGTPSYMAPEQAAADSQVDQRADIYALGILAYEILTGRPPFTGVTAQQVLVAHVTQPPAPLTRQRPGLPASLEQVVLRCLEKRAADRFQTADELLAQLEPMAMPGGTAPPAAPPPAALPGQGTGGRRKAVWFGGAMALAVALALVWEAHASHRPGVAVVPDDVQVTFTGNATAPSLSASGTRMAYAARRCDSAGTCLYDVVIQDVGGTGLATVATGLTNVWSTEWTRDGRYLLVGGSFNAVNWGLYSASTLGGAPRFLGCCRGSLAGNGDTTLVSDFRLNDTVASLRRVRTADGAPFDSISIPKLRAHGVTAKLSGDSRWLVLLNGENREFVSVVIAERDGLPRDTIAFPVERPARGILAVPGSSRIVIFAETGRGSDVVSVVEHTIDGHGRVSQPGDTLIRSLVAGDAFSASSAQTLAYASGTPAFGVWAFQRTGDGSRMLVHRLANSTSIALGADASPDGKTILLVRDVAANGATLRQLSLMPADSGGERLLGHPADLIDWDLASGEVLAAIRAGDSVSVVTMDTVTGRARSLATYAQAAYGTLKAMPGGGFVMLNAGGNRIVRRGVPGAPDTVLRLSDEAGPGSHMDVSPDGRSVVLANWNATLDSVVIRRISMENGATVRLAAIAAERPDAPRWLVNGRILVPVDETGSTVGLYQLPAAGGPAMRLGALPLTEGRYRFSADGRRGVIRTADRSSDVHVIRNFGALVR